VLPPPSGSPYAGPPPPSGSPYAAPPQPYPGAGGTPRKTWKTVLLVLALVIGIWALGIIAFAGVCYGIVQSFG